MITRGSAVFFPDSKIHSEATFEAECCQCLGCLDSVWSRWHTLDSYAKECGANGPSIGCVIVWQCGQTCCRTFSAKSAEARIASAVPNLASEHPLKVCSFQFNELRRVAIARQGRQLSSFDCNWSTPKLDVLSLIIDHHISDC